MNRSPMRAIVAALALCCAWPAFAAVTLTDGRFAVYRSGIAQAPTAGHANYAECRTALATQAAAETRTSGTLTWGCRQNVTARYAPNPTCPPLGRVTECPSGMTGAYTQTQVQAWNGAACAPAGDWLPAEPPAGICLPPDSDNDGVPDSADECPTVHAPTPNGCPAPPVDTQPPSAPTLTATVESTAAIVLSWTAATDNVGVTGYVLERCAGAGCTNLTELQRLTATTYRHGTLPVGSTWNYRVRALDAAGNAAASAIVSATTLSDTPSAQWTHCANQGELCAFAGTRRLRYGADTRWVERDIVAENGGWICDNRLGNPAVGVSKTCQLQGSVTPPPDPPPAQGPGTATVSWQPTTQNVDGSSANITGYRIVYGQRIGELVHSIEVLNAGQTSYIVTNIPAGAYYFGVEALAGGNKSSVSHLVAKTVL